MYLFLVRSGFSKYKVKSGGCWRLGHTKRRLTKAGTEPTKIAVDKEEVIYEAISGNAVRMLKFMSLTGSIAACTATVSTGIAQLQDALGENDLGVHSLALASFVSIMSTVVITKMFSPFVTKVIMLPTASTKSIKIDKHGLPTFESILSASRTKDAAGPKLNRHFSLSGSATKDTVLVLETPGLFGFNSRHTKVGINDLAPSPKRMRTWDMTATKIRLLREKGIKPPVTTFTIMWRSLKDSPNRRLLEEINSLVGSD